MSFFRRQSINIFQADELFFVGVISTDPIPNLFRFFLSQVAGYESYNLILFQCKMRQFVFNTHEKINTLYGFQKKNRKC